MADSENTDDYEITTKGEEDTENVEEDEQNQTSFGATPSSTTSLPTTGSAAAAAQASGKPMKKKSSGCFKTCKTFPFGNTLELDECVDEWIKYYGKIEYYRYKRRLHHGICFRQVEGPANAVAKADITVTDNSWWLRVRKTEWKPGDKPVVVCERKWHVASLLMGVHQHAQTFGDWKAFKTNCKMWTQNVLQFLKKEEIQCDRCSSYDEFRKLATKDLELSLHQT